MEPSASVPVMPIASQSPKMTIREMWDLSHRGQEAWGVHEYECPRKYYDQRREKELADWRAGKTQMAPSILKKKTFLDEIVNKTTANCKPYDVSIKWVKESDKTRKLSPIPRRTYIDEIVQNGAKRPSPSPSEYFKDVDKRMAEKIKAMDRGFAKKGSERISYLSEYEYVSSTLPGPGTYEHDKKLVAKSGGMKPTDKIKADKEKEELSRSRAHKLPSIWTYSPIPGNFSTFDKIQQIMKDPSKKPKSDMPKAKRFNIGDTSKEEKNNKSLSPGPGKYDVTSVWPGKEKGKDAKKNPDILTHVTKGPYISIYYSHEF